MQRNSNILQNIDWITVALYIILCVFGWINIAGASHTYDQESFVDLGTYAGKQLIWLGGAFLLSIIVLTLDYKIYDASAYVVYGLMILALIATRFLSPPGGIKGSYSWIALGSSFRLQPAEFAKLTTALAIAKFMGQYEFRMRSWRDLVTPLLMIGVPMAIIMIWEKETGSALIFASFLLVFYRQGMSGYVLLCGLAAIALFIIAVKYNATPLPFGTGTVGITVCMGLITIIGIFFLMQENRYNTEKIVVTSVIAGIYAICLLLNIWIPVNFNVVGTVVVCLFSIYLIGANLYKRNSSLVLVGAFMLMSTVYTNMCDWAFTKVLQDHQRKRIELLLGMIEDPNGVGYNVNQARIAIGSGGFLGKGYLHGTQTQMKFVPEQATDFIFTTVGEEWGFIGTSVVLLLYLVFILRIIFLAERQRDNFSRIYAYSVASIFLFHLIINIGMVLGVLPVIGIPLPFFSYGGSSLWGFTLLLFIMLRLDAAGAERLR